MPENLVHSLRAIAVMAAATLVSATAVVLLSAQTPSARAASAPGSTVRASVVDGTNAEAPDGAVRQELSADGTAVVFTAYDKLDNLDTGDYENVYVRDLRTNRTVMISRGQFTRPAPPEVPSTPGLAAAPLLNLSAQQQEIEPGEVPPSLDSTDPTISADGRYVAFTSTADNIVPEDDDSDADIILCDRDPDGDGEFDENRENGERDYVYFRVNEPGYYGEYRTDRPARPQLSDGAERIAWVDRQDGNLNTEVRTAALVPVTGGQVGPPATIDRLLPKVPDFTTYSASQADVSGNGRYVVMNANFTSWPDPDSSNQVGYQAIMRYDTVTGTYLRADLDLATTPEEPVYVSGDRSTFVLRPAISFDGTVIAFEAEEYRSWPCDGDCWYPLYNQPNVYVARLGPNGEPVDSVLVSRDNQRKPINGFAPGLSGDGRFVAFVTDNLGAHDGVDVEDGQTCLFSNTVNSAEAARVPPEDESRHVRTTCQVVLRDLEVDRQRLVDELDPMPGTLVSPGRGTDCAATVPEGATCAGNSNTTPEAWSTPPSLSENGSEAAYDSNASNLVENDTNEVTDVFVRTMRPELAPDPDPLDFGEVEIDDSFEQSVRFDHVGTGPLVVEEVAVDGPDADDFTVGGQTCAGELVVLQQTDSCLVSLEFKPSAEGDREATLRLTVRGEREFTVDLRGVGSTEPVDPPGPDGDARFAAGPDPLAFGQRLPLSTGVEPAVTVTNRGDAALEISAVTVVSAVAPNDYAITTNTCVGAPVPVDGTCQVKVRFSPTAPGDRPAVLRFDDNAIGGPHLVGLSGSGSLPAIEISPGVTPPSRVIAVTGTGFAPNQAITLAVPGGVTATPAVTDATGTFRGALLILPKGSSTARLVTAAVTAFPTIRAERPVLIVTPTVSPADFVVRG